MSAPILPKSCSLIALFQRQHMFFNFENKVWQWRIGGWGTFRNGTTHLLSDLSLKTRVGSTTSVPFGQNVRKNLACGPSLENVIAVRLRTRQNLRY